MQPNQTHQPNRRKHHPYPNVYTYTCLLLRPSKCNKISNNRGLCNYGLETQIKNESGQVIMYKQATEGRKGVTVKAKRRYEGRSPKRGIIAHQQRHQS
jgi:hypothetical protein